MTCCVYILRCIDNSLYTGWTNDFEKRILKHNQGKASKYTRVRLPVVPVYCEKVASKSMALKREFAIKQLTRAAKEQLIAGTMVDHRGNTLIACISKESTENTMFF